MKTQIGNQQTNAFQQSTLSFATATSNRKNSFFASRAKSVFLMAVFMLGSMAMAKAQTPSVVPSYCIPNAACYYYLAFVTGSIDPWNNQLPLIDATSGNIANYNNFVMAAAAAPQGPNPSLNAAISAAGVKWVGGAPVWYALASTPTVNAISNIAPIPFTYPVLNVHTGGPNIVSLSPTNWLNQTLLDTNIGMWVDKFGELNRSNFGAWTGTNNTGGMKSVSPLGGCTAPCSVTWSSIGPSLSNWIASGSDSITSQKEMYAISGLLCAGAGCNACTPPPPSMVAWYSFDQTGSSQNDLTSYHNTATAVGTTSIAGEVSNALQFDGTDDYVQASNATQLNLGTGNLSLDVWVKISGAPLSVVSLVDKRQGGVGYQFFLYNYLGTGSSEVGLQLADGVGTGFANYFSSAAVPADNRWHLLAVTVVRNSHTGGTFYVDGVAKGTFDPTAHVGSLNSGAALDIGVQLGGGESFKGALDELEIFNRALSLTEVQTLYLAGAHGKCK
jgi:hypothetical protein